MGVNIDPSGRDYCAVGIDELVGRLSDRADLDDLAVSDPNIRGVGPAPGAIDDGAAFDRHIEHVRS